MFGNVGSLSIAVIGTLCADEPLVSMVGPTCNVKGREGSRCRMGGYVGS